IFLPEDIKKIKEWRKKVNFAINIGVNKYLKPVVDIEDLAAELYSIYAFRFREIPEIGDFFEEMVHEERLHSSIVRLISELVWRKEHLEKLKKVIPISKLNKLKKNIVSYKRRAYKMSLKEAFSAAVELESLERDAWPMGVIQTLTKIIPDAFKELPKFVFDGEGSHSNRLMRYMRMFIEGG
ncbi:MAG: hypothetical protein NZ870_00280, partial [bacterium]|nr:hypothetical protein [bacterium]